MIEFKTIYADPPWHFDDKLDKTRHKPYQTLTWQQIRDLPIDCIAQPESHVYLWVPSAFLREGLKIIKAWGFDYKCHIVWIKRTNKGKLWFGMGRNFRHCNELCLFGSRNNFRVATNNTRNLIDTLKPKGHSSKPDEMYELIENNSFEPYLELFATKKREGWTSWGYDIDGQDIREVMQEWISKQVFLKIQKSMNLN